MKKKATKPRKKKVLIKPSVDFFDPISICNAGIYAKLAAVPIEAVAHIAVSLSQSEPNPHKSVAKAYHILEIAAAAQASLGADECFELGITQHIFMMDLLRELAAKEDALPADIAPIAPSKGDNLSRFNPQEFIENYVPPLSTGDPLPVPFDNALNNFMPKWDQATKESRLIDWWADTAKIPPKEANMEVVGWKKRGNIPPLIYRSARRTFRAWWKSQVSSTRSMIRKEALAKKDSVAPPNKKKTS